MPSVQTPMPSVRANLLAISLGRKWLSIARRMRLAGRSARCSLHVVSLERKLTVFTAILILGLLPASIHAQMVDDGVELSKGVLCTGSLYTHDAWDHYWEGKLNRTNGNLGTVTTQMITSTANYGVTKRLNVIGEVPFIWTNASQGVLHGQHGVQDLTLAAKYRLLQFSGARSGSLKVFGVVSGSIPIGSYDPDFQPMSIGLGAKTLTPRATLNYEGMWGSYVDVSAAYVFRSNVTLDRSSYYTNGQLYLSNQVAMPNQLDYMVSAGYRKHDLMIVGNFAQQQTRGGGDIRRQDMPFISNRMNYSKAGARVVIPIPHLKGFQYWFMYSNTIHGQNVGQANTFTSGLMYQIRLSGRGKTR